MSNQALFTQGPNTMKFDSDVDLLVDFPLDLESQAWRYAESACLTRELTPDIKPLRYCEKQFIERIMQKSRALQ